jgi:hypothetical protein
MLICPSTRHDDLYFQAIIGLRIARLLVQICPPRSANPTEVCREILQTLRTASTSF